MSVSTKPLFEADGYKPVSKKFLPTPGRGVYVSESRLVPTTAGRDAKGNVVVVGMKVQRKTVCGMRDKMALASSTAKRTRFAVGNESLDRRLDAPVVRIGYHAKAKVVTRRGNSLRSQLS